MGPTVVLPDRNLLKATSEGILNLLPKLTNTAKKDHVFDIISNSSLISIGQLCDDDCVAVLQKRKINIYKNKKCIINGKRNFEDGLWDVELPVKLTQTMTAQNKSQHGNNRL